MKYSFWIDVSPDDYNSPSRRQTRVLSVLACYHEADNHKHYNKVQKVQKKGRQFTREFFFNGHNYITIYFVVNILRIKSKLVQFLKSGQKKTNNVKIKPKLGDPGTSPISQEAKQIHTVEKYSLRKKQFLFPAFLFT